MKNFLKQTISLNKSIIKNNLSILNFGNGSVIDRKSRIVYIKASGVLPNEINENKVVGVKLKSNNTFKVVYNKKLQPSVDLDIHLKLYNYFKNINSIIHVHSCFATILSQLEIEPKCIGTTHADFYDKPIPLSDTVKLKSNKVKEYNDKVFLSIKKRLEKEKNFPPGILLRGHGALSWCKNIYKTIENSVALEFICKLYYHCSLLKKNISLESSLIKFHYDRKNGKNKRYGQYKK